MIDKKEAYKIITDYFKDKPVKKIQVFGSFARGEQGEGSDIDILLEMEHPVGLMALARYRLELEDLTNLEVDLGTSKGVSKYARPYIERDLETVYEK
jgi:predicted nucleotidyltransferase